MLLPHDHVCDLYFELFAICKSASEGSILPFSNSVLHQAQHLHFGNIALENRFGIPKFTLTNLIMSSSEGHTCHSIKVECNNY